MIFDLGGVIVELGNVRDLFGPKAGVSADNFWQQWLTSPSVAAFERGAMEPEAFTSGVVEEFGLNITADVFAENFTRWPQGLFDGAAAVVHSIPDTVVTASASNTNQMHWESSFVRFGLVELFDHHYPSFQLGEVKPSAAYFNAILADLADKHGLTAAEVGFLDDNQINVDGARACGIRAERAQGPSEVRTILTEWRVL